MDSRVRASPEQLSTLLEYMESHGDLARPVAGAQGRVRSDQLWSDLTNILNSVGGGVNKTTDKWKKVWADLKSKTKKKGLTLRQHARGTGGGPASQKSLSHLEERVLAIIGPTAVEGQDSIQELGFSRPQSSAPAPSQSSAVVAQEDDPVYVDYGGGVVKY
ncbi:myb-related transcription factor, partner of profilin-like [Amyelois transitella]|uniref:myb-related transcription factor, partner of profilin-like n=2 Tax=Amyelois transitella TaxID=680683 RepID=UPI0029907DFE|nr:myb-related transcription factor, partner of profilin-like [Amyelois transitella]XP_060801524.1 myb-related transcription factor, partner of profilin-like [Amyelois transitella]XP_060810150.1 myb-related transcription factor, partner of profilin-like [Amyelois transitella]XP_060810198.1 myb-related transcription factor, partner of profilin-like [Amyelois transitella]